MRIRIEEDFLFALESQVHFIAKDKPQAAKKFKSDLLQKLKKDLKFPFHYKKSIYYDDESIRDYVFKGYVSVYKIDSYAELVTIFGFIKYKESL
jgi:plasmid stabilization system protein ParE